MAYMHFEAAANADGRAQDAVPYRGWVNWGVSMGRIIITLICLVFLGFVALVGYAYSGFLQPDVRTVTEPVALDLD